MRVVVLSALLGSLAACGSDCEVGPISTSTLSDQQRLEMRLLMPWFEHAKACKVAGYNVIGPEAQVNGDLTVLATTGTAVTFTGPSQVAVFTKSKATATIEVGEDGSLVRISYTGKGIDGTLVSFVDEDGDGRIDTQIGSAGVWVNVDGQWAKVEKRGERPGAVVLGKWAPMKKVGRVWVVDGE
jgi:hypothetical protein